MQEPDNRTIEEFNADYEKMRKEKPEEFAKFCYDRNWDPEKNCFKPMKYLQLTEEEIAFANAPYHITKIVGKSFRDKMDRKVDHKTALDGYKLVMVVYTASWEIPCKPFKDNLKNYYKVWNHKGKKNL